MKERSKKVKWRKEIEKKNKDIRKLRIKDIIKKQWYKKENKNT